MNNSLVGEVENQINNSVLKTICKFTDKPGIKRKLSMDELLRGSQLVRRIVATPDDVEDRYRLLIRQQKTRMMIANHSLFGLSELLLMVKDNIDDKYQKECIQPFALFIDGIVINNYQDVDSFMKVKRRRLDIENISSAPERQPEESGPAAQQDYELVQRRRLIEVLIALQHQSDVQNVDPVSPEPTREVETELTPPSEHALQRTDNLSRSLESIQVSPVRRIDEDSSTVEASLLTEEERNLPNLWDDDLLTELNVSLNLSSNLNVQVIRRMSNGRRLNRSNVIEHIDQLQDFAHRKQTRRGRRLNVTRSTQPFRNYLDECNFHVLFLNSSTTLLTELTSRNHALDVTPDFRSIGDDVQINYAQLMADVRLYFANPLLNTNARLEMAIPFLYVNEEYDNSTIANTIERNINNRTRVGNVFNTSFIRDANNEMFAITAPSPIPLATSLMEIPAEGGQVSLIRDDRRNTGGMLELQEQLTELQIANNVSNVFDELNVDIIPPATDQSVPQVNPDVIVPDLPNEPQPSILPVDGVIQSPDEIPLLGSHLPEQGQQQIDDNRDEQHVARDASQSEQQVVLALETPQVQNGAPVSDAELGILQEIRENEVIPEVERFSLENVLEAEKLTRIRTYIATGFPRTPLELLNHIRNLTNPGSILMDDIVPAHFDHYVRMKIYLMCLELPHLDRNIEIQADLIEGSSIKIVIR